MKNLLLLLLAAMVSAAAAICAAPAGAVPAWKFPAPPGMVISQVRTDGYRVSWSPVRGPSGQVPSGYTVSVLHGGKLAARWTAHGTAAASYGPGGRGLAPGTYRTQVRANGSPVSSAAAAAWVNLYPRTSSSGPDGSLGGWDEPGEMPASDGNNEANAISNMWGCDPSAVRAEPGPDNCGQQVLSGDSPSGWQVTSNQLKGNQQVMTYPDLQEVLTGSNGINPLVSSFRKITSTFATSNPRYGDYEAAYDLWLDVPAGRPDEIMIWDYNHGQTPSGSPAGRVTFAGVAYDVYVDPGATVNFVRVRNVTAGTEHILAMLDWLRQKGYEPAGQRLSQADFGWEICGTDGPETFRVRDYTLITSPATGNED